LNANTIQAFGIITAKFRDGLDSGIKVGEEVIKGILRKGNYCWVEYTGCLKKSNIFIIYNMTREVIE